MALLENQYVIQKKPWNANFTEMNHLGAALIAKPHVMRGKMQQLFSTTMYSENALISYLTQTGRTETLDATEWTWELRGASTRPLVQMVTVSGTVGTYNTEWEIALDEPFYKAGDVITPGNPAFQVRVQKDPTLRGNQWIYRVSYMTLNGALAFPEKYLKAGQRWNKLFSQYEEGSEQGGSTMFALPMTLKNRMSRFRKEYKITGDAATQVLSVKVPDSKGNLYDMWMKYAEAEYWKQWNKELEIGSIYSRSTDQVKGSTGRPIRTGPGIEEQLEGSHRYSYSNLTARLLEEFTMDIFYSRIKPGSTRKLVALTGEYGMIQFHRAVTREYKNNGFVTVDSNFIGPDGNRIHSNALSYGYQFTRYKMANGAELELMHCPLYDDPTLNYEIDPVTGYPIESQKFTFLDVTGEGSSSNIRLVNKRDGMSLVYVEGLVGPYGPNRSKSVSHAGDYYEMHVKDFGGVHIEDISRCGQLILNRG